MKRKCPRLAEVQVQSAADSLPTGGAATHTFTIRLPHGASVLVPMGFDPDELLSLLVVIQESLS